MDDMLDVSCLMLATMSPELQKQHEDMNAYDMIQNLKEIYEGQARQERYETSKALFQCKMSEGSPVGVITLTKDPESTQAENSSTCRDTYLGRQGKYNREYDMISIFFQTPLNQERVKPRPKTISRADPKPKTQSLLGVQVSAERSRTLLRLLYFMTSRVISFILDSQYFLHSSSGEKFVERKIYLFGIGRVKLKKRMNAVHVRDQKHELTPPRNRDKPVTQQDALPKSENQPRYLPGQDPLSLLRHPLCHPA
ncbi:hypothetical protein V6N12_045894 [Hibiscus sabdariffa]|uniref:Uncharacterized protein n=1 Tax=Hibiscus sabdariffa TaxID=183260 RepID=A0ABR2G408_9ROSI